VYQRATLPGAEPRRRLLERLGVQPQLGESAKRALRLELENARATSASCGGALESPIFSSSGRPMASRYSGYGCGPISACGTPATIGLGPNSQSPSRTAWLTTTSGALASRRFVILSAKASCRSGDVRGNPCAR